MAKKGFDPSKMKTIKSFAVKDGDDKRYIVELYRYNKGEPRISLKAQIKNKDGDWIFVKATGVSSPRVAGLIGKAFGKLAKIQAKYKKES